jgi:transcription elongation factor GreA
MSSDYIYLSREGYENLKAELHELKTVKRPQIVDEIRRARELGDLSENAEYHAAKEAQTHIERKIGELELEMSRAQIATDAHHDPGTAALLSSVQVRDLEDGEEITYLLVAPPEADASQDKISVGSPVGKALLGHRVGDRVTVETPGGKIGYEILTIRSQFDAD